MRRPHITLALGAAITLVALAVATRVPGDPPPASFTAPPSPAPRLTTSRARPALAQPAAIDPDAERAAVADVAAVAGLPPEDIDWVLAEVTRTETVRDLSDAERSQLIAELASVRMFTVLEREAPMEWQPEEMP